MARTPGQFAISLISREPKEAPEVSRPGAVGTLQGAMRKTLKGSLFASPRSHRTPESPRTLAISWGLMKTVVVPAGRTVAANWGRVRRVDSV
jgi:hypothetical protein